MDNNQPTPVNEVQKKVARFSFKTAVAILIFLLAGVGFATIAHEIVIEQEHDFDEAVFRFLHPHTNDGTTAIMKLFTILGSSSFLFPAYLVIVVIFLFRKDWRFSLNVAAIGLSSFLMMQLFKRVFQRVRPNGSLVEVSGFSFPSGHSFSSFTFFGLLILIVSKTSLRSLYKWILYVLCFAMAFMVGISRIYLRVHYASDVIAGFLLAIIWLVASYSVLKKLDARKAAKLPA